MMQQMQSELINLLNISLFCKSYDAGNLKDYHWEDIVNEARAHNIGPLIYDAIQKVGIAPPVFDDVKKRTILQSLYQFRYFEEVNHVLRLLTQNDIDVVLLKGAQLRWLYPNPEYRTMGDVDILVAKTSFEKAKMILEDQGYTGNVDNGVHLQCIKSNCLPIEVHWRLTNEKYNNSGASLFEEQIWQNLVSCELFGLPLFILQKEINLVYLILHLSEHIISSGFGLRQLLDIALFIYHNQEFEWDKVVQLAKEVKMEKFLFSILSVCQKLFAITLPERIKDFSSKNAGYVEMLLSEIFDSGAYGNKTSTRVMVKKMTQYRINNNHENLKIVFPGINTIYKEYSYAKKIKLLLPVAWLHRLIKLSIKKMGTLLSANRDRIESGEEYSVTSAYRQRVKLIKWLEIK